MKEIILLYNVSDHSRLRRIKKALLNHNVVIQVIDQKDFMIPIFQLLVGKRNTTGLSSSGKSFSEEMMILAIQRDRLDSILLALKKEGIYIPYKAVVTSQNGWWNSVDLFNELKREHEHINTQK